MANFNDPLSAMLTLQRALEARRESGWMGGGTAGIGAYPPINIFQRGDEFIAIIELPGVSHGDLQIEAKGSDIRISGKKTIGAAQNASVHRRERVSGVFDRTISLPVQIDTNAVQAEYQDGILALTIPRAPSEKPRTIKIN